MLKETLIPVVIAAAALWPTCVTAAAGNDDAVSRLIEQCEKRPAVELVNRLMQAMGEDEPTDEPLRFDLGTPTDSLRQQVRYWAAEWHYARQHYDLAEPRNTLCKDSTMPTASTILPARQCCWAWHRRCITSSVATASPST